MRQARRLMKLLKNALLRRPGGTTSMMSGAFPFTASRNTLSAGLAAPEGVDGLLPSCSKGAMMILFWSAPVGHREHCARRGERRR